MSAIGKKGVCGAFDGTVGEAQNLIRLLVIINSQVKLLD